MQNSSPVTRSGASWVGERAVWCGQAFGGAARGTPDGGVHDESAVSADLVDETAHEFVRRSG
ncbi:hypothetical protein OG799_00890 [Micromonospora sp. NBC_00898]|uniref:hypothetical protein n=1 Tax=Micromonospora sp. NBC_00898 TaxID=2975981 RepID=UPI00386D3F1A|nr:hypothetical protein OG799_00890 [Micromonospora sp. NBC_00898]